MSNKFDNDLKKALTEYEKEIVEDAEKTSKKKKDFFVIKKKWIKYAVGVAAVFAVFIPSVYLGTNLNNNTDNDLSNDLIRNTNTSVMQDEKSEMSDEPLMKDMKKSDDSSTKEVYETDSAEAFIESLSLSAETLDFNKSVEDIEKVLINLKGYIETQDINNVKDSYGLGRSAFYNYKVPNADLDTFIKEFEKLDINITSSNKSLLNVTNEYQDLTKDLDLINSKLDSLQGLLSKATSLTDIIELENKIQEVQAEKVNIEQNLTSLGKDIEYSTVTIDLKEVEKYSGTESANTGFWGRVKQTVKNSYKNFINFLENSALGFITILPFVIIIAVVVFIVIKVKRRNK